MPEGRRIARRAACVLTAQLVVSAVAAAAAAGDRAVVWRADGDGDGRVTIDEIICCASTLLTDRGPVPDCCESTATAC